MKEKTYTTADPNMSYQVIVKTPNNKQEVFTYFKRSQADFMFDSLVEEYKDTHTRFDS